MTLHLAEYDLIGERYSEAKTQPFRIELEAWTLERHLGNVAGGRVLDLACGDGIYSRRLARLGAETVGIDTSAEMIALARGAEEAEPLGCRYLHADVNDIGVLGAFDVVIAAYLLNYASTLEELQRFCDVMQRNLRPGGRVVGVNDFTNDGVIGVRDFTRHGFRKIGPDPYEEGAPITYDFLLPEGRSFSITNYYWAPETYLVMLRGAGFRQAEWHMLEISSDAARRFSPSFFTDLIAQAPIAAFVASK